MDMSRILLYLPNLSIITFIILISIPSALTKGKANHYKECSQTFDIGAVKNISYPFWGGVRHQYCGHPVFQLKIPNDQTNYPHMQIRGLDFYVFNIHTENYTMRVARVDTWNVCSIEKYIDTSVNYDYFDYIASQDAKLFLFYNCSNVSDTNLAPYRFSCTGGPYNFYAPEGMNITGMPSCAATVKMRVIKAELKKLMDGQAGLQEIVNYGFDASFDDELHNCTQCRQSKGVCGSDPQSSRFVCYCEQKAHSLVCPKEEEQGSSFDTEFKIVIGILLSVGSVIICFLNRKRAKSMQFWKSRTRNEKDLDDFIENFGPLPLRRYRFSEVKKMTFSFQDQLGEGAYGSVYKGKLPDNNRLVAVKLLNPAKGKGEEFINEVASISRTSHVNIVSLLGYCLDGDKRALIYEFLPNGSLEKFIYKDSPKNLKWEKLYQIAISIARGLEYLHRGCNTRILHFDIKPHNILLDENFCPKISDFGLSKLCTKNESIVSVLEARGTLGYIAPELFSRNFGDVSHKSDVYSYGMMILEMVGRRKSSNFGVSHNSEVYFPQWIYNQLLGGQDLKLPGVATREDSEIAMKMIIVGLWCIQTLPADRPSITQVIDMLEGSIRALQFPPKPFISSPERSPSLRVSGTFTSKSTLTGSGS